MENNSNNSTNEEKFTSFDEFQIDDLLIPKKKNIKLFLL